MREVWVRRSIVFGLISAFIGAISKLTFVDIDLFHEMALYREVLNRGSILRNDVFSYIPTLNPVVHHEWGTGAILYWVTVETGFAATGLMILKYLLSLSVAFGCYTVAIRNGASRYVFSFLAFFGIALGWIGFTTIRSQLFTLLFLTLFLLLVEEDRKGFTTPFFLWLPLYVIWLNVHGGFLVGFGLFVLYIVERVFFGLFDHMSFRELLAVNKRLLATLVLMCLLLPVNPYGLDYVPYLWNAVSLSRSPLIIEWGPLYRSIDVLLVFCISLVVVFYAMSQKRLREMPGLLLIAATAWISFWHYRHLTIFAVVWMCYAPIYIQRTTLGYLIETTCTNHSRLLIALFMTVGVLGAFYASWNQFWKLRIPCTIEKEQKGEPIYPVGAVKYLHDQDFSGNVMSPFESGAYMSWKLYPRVKVSMDSRFEVAYPIESVKENIQFYQAGDNWQDMLERYPTDAILVPRSSKISKFVNLNNGQAKEFRHNWRTVYLDDVFSIYIRSNIANQYPFIDRRGELISDSFP
jgi:hypothetical protein